MTDIGHTELNWKKHYNYFTCAKLKTLNKWIKYMYVFQNCPTTLISASCWLDTCPFLWPMCKIYKNYTLCSLQFVIAEHVTLNSISIKIWDKESASTLNDSLWQNPYKLKIWMLVLHGTSFLKAIFVTVSPPHHPGLYKKQV